MMQQQYLELVRKTMREQKISGAEMARNLNVSPSWVNLVLRGDYPYSGAWGWPFYMDRYFVDRLGLPHYQPEAVDA